MCGIAGLVSFGPAIGPERIGEMARSLRHRGPDDEGYLAAETGAGPIRPTLLYGADSTVRERLPLGDYSGPARLYLGHRRLSIIDLSSAGRQPMPYAEDLWIVHNGEIYNYLELRQELMAEGYRFRTQTDTEVILAAYDRWGEECVRRFNGDWAFCILDAGRGSLFLSRDRYGIKPLYFFHDEGKSFAFASEIKALLTLPEVPRELDRETAFQYLVLHCLDHSEKTLYRKIFQVSPGGSMRVDLRTHEVRKWNYYTLSFCAELGAYDHSKAVAHVAEIRDLIFDSVRIRLRADVPVGTCLSGGVDSSAIVAVVSRLLAEKNGDGRQHTFTASFPGEPIDEAPYARAVVESAGTEGHFILPSREGFEGALPGILHHQDEPIGGASVYAQWEVMREASRHVKVVLDGQGGDEVFAGYRNYRVSFFAHLLAEGRLGQLAKELWKAFRNAKNAQQGFAEVKQFPFFALSDPWKRRIYRVSFRKSLKAAREMLALDGGEDFSHIDKKFAGNMNELLFHFLMEYSLPHLLKWEDRNSMAHSIEARVPFTDYRLVDYLFSLPGVYKVQNGWTKWLLRLAVEDLLPPEIVWRRDKLGFAAPPWASRRKDWDLWMGQNFAFPDRGRVLSADA